ncbi:DUF5615 family PIN-like protein [Nonomuraea sp. NPDC047897]|uniref:DUF5615 family PIN-like protein n=1 Tax=Nonomuraea sp. NPDC047897 TaxID=3364346 RepID=UPI00371E38A8
MNFLVDENLSPRVAELLTKAGNDAVHVRDLQATSASDSTIMQLAVADVRELVELRPPDLVTIILANLEVLEQHLRTGAIAAFAPAGIRVRALPLR